MTDTVTILPGMGSTYKASFEVLFAANAYTADLAARRRAPLFVPRNQAYFWTAEWQAGEREALAELAKGEGRRFNSGAAAAAWLLSDDD
jgi:hypothetical protein